MQRHSSIAMLTLLGSISFLAAGTSSFKALPIAASAEFTPRVSYTTRNGVAGDPHSKLSFKRLTREQAARSKAATVSGPVPGTLESNATDTGVSASMRKRLRTGILNFKWYTVFMSVANDFSNTRAQPYFGDTGAGAVVAAGELDRPIRNAIVTAATTRSPARVAMTIRTAEEV